MIKRQWLLCKKCQDLSYYDYVPGKGPPRPLLALPCGHGNPNAGLSLKAFILTDEEARIALAGHNKWKAAQQIEEDLDAHVQRLVEGRSEDQDQNGQGGGHGLGEDVHFRRARPPSGMDPVHGAATGST